MKGSSVQTTITPGSYVGPIPANAAERDIYISSVAATAMLAKDSDADVIDRILDRALIALARPRLPEHDDYTWFRNGAYFV